PACSSLCAPAAERKAGNHHIRGVGTMIIKRVGVMKLAIFQGALLALFGLLAAIFMLAVGSMFGAKLGAFGMAAGVAALIILPIFCGVLGFIVGAIYAALYNLVAGMVGGIEIEGE